MLIPFGLQFAHAFESHEHLHCNTIYQEHLHEHEFDCKVFHYKINTNSSSLSSAYELVNVEVYDKKIANSNSYIPSRKILCESPRGPPILLF